MSQEFGGRSDKFGNEFERLWVVSLALRILDGTATSLLWEPLGPPGKGIELRLTLPDGIVEAHQCKIENGYHGNWTVHALRKAGVVDAARTQLDRSDVDRFVFVSRDPCRTFDDLTDRAARCNDDANAFLNSSLSSKKHRDEFACLCDAWELSTTEPENVSTAIRLLRRIRTERGFWQDSELLRLEREARAFAKGEGKAIVDSLSRFLSDSLGNEINATQLRHHLREDSLPPRDLIDDPSVATAVERLQSDFRRSLTEVLAGNILISRPVANEVHDLLADQDGPRLILLHGRAGHGKSGVLLELTNRLSELAVPFLPLRLDSQRPEGGDAYFRDILGLDAHPVRCLRSIAGNEPAVLIIDQLDAVRWTASHSDSAWQICREMIELALVSSTIRVVVACRTFDLEDDRRFKAWESELATRYRTSHPSKRVEVVALDGDVVRQFVEQHDQSYDQLAPRQRELLRIPLCLYLWWTLKSESLLPDTYSTASDLMRIFWRSRREKLTTERGVSESQLAECLDRVVDYLDREGRQDFPAMLVEQFPRIVDAIRSLHLVQSARTGTLKFAHQSFLDYLVAERVVRESLDRGTSPLVWLRSHDQSLFRREQLRQLLMLLKEQSPDQYVLLLRQLLHDSDVRFHLRHLALGILRSSDKPTDEECQLLQDLLADDKWRRHALRFVVLGHVGWMQRCHDNGLFREWLASENEETVNDAVWMFRWAPNSHRNLVDESLEPFANFDDAVWASRIDGTLPSDIRHDTEASFEWRWQRVRSGALRIELYSLHSVVQDHPLRVARLLEAAFERQIDLAEEPSDSNQEGDDRRLQTFEQSGWDEILEHIGAAGVDGWACLLPVLIRSVAVTRKVRRAQLRRRRKTNPTSLFLPIDRLWTLHRAFKKINCGLLRLLTQIGRKIARSNFTRVWKECSDLDLSRSRTLNRLVCNVLLAARSDRADVVLSWLLADPRRFRVGNSHARLPQKPAASLIARFAPVCSDTVIYDLESAVLKHHGPEEKYSVQIQLERLKESGILLSNHYGRSQLVLLVAMPNDRLGQIAKSALSTWLGKFGHPQTWEHDSRARTGFVSSSVPRERLHLVSNKTWLRMIATDWENVRHKRRSEDWLAERSHRMFARDLGELTKMAPARFIQLAHQIPVESPIDYFECILRGLDQRDEPQNRPNGLPEWEPASFEEIQALILKLMDAGLASEELTNAICWIVRNRSNEQWDIRVTDLIADACIHAPTPTGEPNQGIDRELNPWEGQRGVAVEALHQLVSNHSEYAVRYLPEICRSVRDTHPCVRVSAAGVCCGLARWNIDSAVELFVSSCDHPDERVLSGLYVPHFLSRTWSRFPKSIEPLLRRMIDSANSDVAECGAYWATAGSVAKGLYVDLADTCCRGNVSQRTGVAGALVDLATTDEHRDAALQLLPQYFSDPDESVSNKAAHIFHRNTELLALPVGPSLALEIANSQAFHRDPSDLLMPLNRYAGSLLPYTEVMTAVVTAAAGPLASLNGDIQTRHAMVSRALPDVLLRLYQEADGAGNTVIRNVCLDAWDRLLESQVVSLDTLIAIDS